MEELIKRLERVIQTGAPDKDGQHPISAETVLEVVKAQLGTNLAEVGTDCSEFPNNSDAISRQQAIDAFYLYPNINWTTLDILKKINEMPTIRPKRGRWIGKYPVSSACSECGYLINDSKVKVFAFCPNCGAKMEATE